MDQETLKSILHYDPITGFFTNKKDRNWKAKAGLKTGNKYSNGYVAIKINQKRFLAHRLAFLYMTGEIPVFVDHINGIVDDNSWSNLRACTKAQNNANAKTRKDNRLNTKGVSEIIGRDLINKYVAKITIDGRPSHLGCFSSIEAAKNAFDQKHLEIYGEFSKA